MQRFANGLPQRGTQLAICHLNSDKGNMDSQSFQKQQLIFNFYFHGLEKQALYFGGRALYF